MGSAMDRISQVPPESTRHGAEAATLTFLSIFLAENAIGPISGNAVAIWFVLASGLT
jgi:hypothetical protein